MVEAYCVKCRAKREIKDPKQVTMKNGKPATQGICPVCGTKLFRIGSSAASNFGRLKIPTEFLSEWQLSRYEAIFRCPGETCVVVSSSLTHNAPVRLSQ